MSAHDHADSEPEAAVKMESLDAPVNGTHLKNGDSRPSSQSPLPPKKESSPNSDVSNTMNSKLGEIVLKQEPGQLPKLSRSSSQKVALRPPPLYTHLPDSTQDALATFEQIPGCIYANKYMGYTEHAMECDCAEEWGKFGFLFFLSRLSVFFPDPQGEGSEISHLSMVESPRAHR